MLRKNRISFSYFRKMQDTAPQNYLSEQNLDSRNRKRKGILIKGFLIFLAMSLFVNIVCAQSNQIKKQSPFIFEAQYSAGKVVPVYRNFPKTTFANTAEIFLGYQTYGNRKWHKLFNYPRLGVSLMFQELGNSRVLGQQISIVPTVYFSTAKKEDAKVFAEIRYGVGLACFTRPYDSIRNPDNSGAGSYCTWQVTLGANLRWNISRHLSLQLGGIWYHASNAHTKLPNVGVNNFAVYLGLLVYPFGRMSRSYSLDTVMLDLTAVHHNQGVESLFSIEINFQPPGGLAIVGPPS